MGRNKAVEEAEVRVTGVQVFKEDKKRLRAARQSRRAKKASEAVELVQVASDEKG